MATKTERLLVTERAFARCEYCRAPQVVTGATFHIEHIGPSARGGQDDLSNYALCCSTCNGHKADFVTGIDPESGRKIALFNPRRDRWGRYFRFAPASLRVIGITSKGRATVARLLMNEPKQIEARSLWVEIGLYP
jgi:hypothetical protein